MRTIRTCAVIFGGGGFIGLNLASQLLSAQRVDKVYVCDLSQVQCPHYLDTLRARYSAQHFEQLECDVRKPIQLQIPEAVRLICNCAAIHREPGHQAIEYFETNLQGAQHVCDWAVAVQCQQILFTSSIAVYGLNGDSSKTESSIPVPNSPYGASKLAAEKIHESWLAEDRQARHLVIVRPGVVFGAYEGGNVSRMIKAIHHRCFFYMGNKQVRKAGIYVKELCRAMLWALDKQLERAESLTLFNGVMPEPPSMEQYVLEITRILGRKSHILNIPYGVLYLMSWVLHGGATLLQLKLAINPVRVKKLVHSNNIEAKWLLEHGYPYQYSLRTALLDWVQEAPEDWHKPAVS